MTSNPPLPRCPCPHTQDYHDESCPHYQEIMARARRHPTHCSTPETTGPDQSDCSVTARENLSLVSIDSHRHLAAPFEIVQACCFASWATASSTTIHRFVTALVMTGNLTSPGMWNHVLQDVTDLEAQDAKERTAAP